MIYCWLYVILNSLSSLLRQVGGLQINPAFILLVGCIVAVIYFHLLNIKNIKQTYVLCWHYKLRWFAINFSIAMIWLTAIYAPSYIGASLYIFLFFAILGLMGMFSLLIKQPEQDFKHYLSIIGLLAIVGWVLIHDLNHHPTLKHIAGLIMTGIGSVSAFIYAKQSVNFTKLTKIKATDMLAVRFYLAIFISMFLVNITDITEASNHTILWATFIGVFCLIVPLYFSQVGILRAGAERYAVICSSTPFLTAIFEEIIYKDVTFQSFIIYFTYILFSLIPFLSHRMQNKKII